MGEKRASYRHLQTLIEQYSQKWQDQKVVWNVTRNWTRELGLTKEQAATEATQAVHSELGT